MQDSTFLPDLRVFPTERLLPHEEFDPRRIEKLALRLREDGILKHPPIVTEVPCQDDYVILDGANRVMAFQHLGIPHIVAQRIDYDQPGLILDTWYHVVAGMPVVTFNQELTLATGMSLVDCSIEEARLAMDALEAAAYIVCEDGVRMVCNSTKVKHHKLRHDSDLLNMLVSVYKGKANIFRASNDKWEIQKPYYQDITALVIFPRLKPADIIEAACTGERLPTGISRHIIPARALNINIPIDSMDNNQSKETKDKWLQKWLMDRMSANSIRFYAESTFSFNE